MRGFLDLRIIILLSAAFLIAATLNLKKIDNKQLEKLTTSLVYSSPTPTSTPTPTPTPTSTPTPTATPKPTAAPNPTSPPAPVNNTPPGAGFSRQSVQTERGTFSVAIVAADMGSTKVIVDTASDSDCGNNCPVLSLGDYVSRNGAYAGINGSFFCPTEYPSCAGKTNSFDTLLMNKNKHYFNSDNNVYSNIPAVIFGFGTTRFVSRSLEWGRDTSPDGVIANYPMLVLSDQIVYGSDSPNEPKFGAKGARDFVAGKGNSVYIGIVYGATMSDAAYVLKAMGMRDALNLDEGGSTALWSGGYVAGPGRGIPNAILFVQR